MFKVFALWPPDESDPPKAHNAWRWLMAVSVYALTITMLWMLGLSPLPGSPIENLQLAQGELKSAVVCANLKSDLERTRAELYAVQREVEMTPAAQLSQTVLRRRAELEAAVRDNETRYEKNGCYTVIG